jgi:hypothetical protein
MIPRNSKESSDITSSFISQYFNISIMAYWPSFEDNKPTRTKNIAFRRTIDISYLPNSWLNPSMGSNFSVIQIHTINIDKDQ